MTVLRVLAKRVAMGIGVAWGVLTVVFVLFTATEDWVLGQRIALLRWGGASEQEVSAARESYLASRGLDRPLYEQYVDWMGDMVVLEWGESFASGEPVFPMVMDAVGRTAMYVLPAVLVGIALGVLIGLYVGLHPDSRSGTFGRASSYLLFAVPGFWIGGLLLSLAREGVIAHSPLLFDHVLPIALTTATLLGGYVSYTRAHVIEYASADFVSLVRAKGAPRRRVAVHILRNAAIPVFSMLFTEALGLLVLSVFVIETLLGIDGFGLMLIGAVTERDLPVILGGTLVIIWVGVVGNTVQDISYGMLDPRIDAGSR